MKMITEKVTFTLVNARSESGTNSSCLKAYIECELEYHSVTLRIHIPAVKCVKKY